ncbi:hypothetical protein D8S78_14585 [Natrialba swarupiae]|nr:hypothetical protein [Natrialba swarupiae]
MSIVRGERIHVRTTSHERYPNGLEGTILSPGATVAVFDSSRSSVFDDRYQRRFGLLEMHRNGVRGAPTSEAISA